MIYRAYKRPIGRRVHTKSSTGVLLTVQNELLLGIICTGWSTPARSASFFEFSYKPNK